MDQTLGQREDQRHRHNQQREKKMKLFWECHINRLKDEIWSSRITTWKSYMTRETSHAVKRRPGQILEGHDLAEDNARQANLEAAC